MDSVHLSNIRMYIIRNRSVIFVRIGIIDDQSVFNLTLYKCQPSSTIFRIVCGIQRSFSIVEALYYSGTVDGPYLVHTLSVNNDY